MTTAFYAPPECIRGAYILLPEEEARHAWKVLRHRPGDIIVVVDGEGNWYRAEVIRSDRGGVEARVLEHRYAVGEPPYRLTLGVAPLKQHTRLEWAVEKAVELGVHTLVPLITARTERPKVNVERLRRIMIAAMKQSARSRLPRLEQPCPFAQMLEGTREGLRLLAHERARRTLMRQLQETPALEEVHVLIGPEGGFSPDEVAQAVEAGWEPVLLGNRRLRAETAAVTAAAGLMLYHDRIEPWQ